MNLLDRNGKPLRGAARQAVLNKLTKEALYPLTDEMIISISFSDRLEKIERQLKYLPISVIFALVLGCAAGKFFKPDLVAVCIGGSAAGATLAIVNRKQGWF